MDTATKADWAEELRRLAKEAEAVALAKADEVFAEVADEHERQTNGYHFECRRFGDFLTVFIERSANQADWRNAEPEIKASTTLNVGKTLEIKLHRGRCFDRRGSLDYTVCLVGENGNKSWGSGGREGPPPKGCRWEVAANMPYIPKSRLMLKRDDPPQERISGMQLYGGEPRAPLLITEEYPRAAKDDEIYFVGIGMTIYAPAGRGQAVYDAILSEIARAYEPPAIAIEAAPAGETGTGSTRSAKAR